MESTFIFPHQLFYPHPAISKKRKIFLIQDPVFFYDREKRLKFHKQKILLHLLSLYEFAEELKMSGYTVYNISVENLNSENEYKSIITKNNITKLHICDVVDSYLLKKIINNCKELGLRIQWYDSPGFLLNQTDVRNEFSNKKSYYMSTFYKKQRKRYNILMNKGEPQGGQWNYDIENRKKLPKHIEIPTISKFNYEKRNFEKFKNTIIRNFNDNPGSLSSFNFPINRQQASYALNDFLQNRIEKFGNYEDAISSDETYLFHGVLTPYLNIGLITPKEVLEQTLEFSNENKIPLNSLEGFIRQIIGWREFVRGIYCINGYKQRTNNFWKFDKKLSKSFYLGKTTIDPVDDTIKKVLSHAYTHHIERLMILGNIMLLLEISPDEVYKWFMEMYIDAYDWVMVPNVYGMSQFADGGLMCTKPYISASNYIIKMSNYNKKYWSEVWDALFWSFINSHREFFMKNYRMNMMVKIYDKKSKIQKNNYEKIKKQFTNLINN
ncbi:MAG: cryptochrome/photolyase family protein [Candidatus Marinimicrobia bacterium]|nr:cryptochrome/photolyase family protein [Candidatus Neomarinimicrobiota bacterium]|tara:strand:+ start:436 stop:1920 length:1485 start_codon:yes stop_codon:yes gene_type:complete